MQKMTFSVAQARSLSLAAQGLLTPLQGNPVKQDVLNAIRRIHALQIDTINIVARAPYHILWSRLGNYQLRWLEELHQEGFLFEYWAHAACFLPIEDYPLYRRIMLDERVGWDNILQWGGENKQVLDEVMTYIHQNGAVKSADFKHPGGGGTWWAWKVEKVALEYLFTRGELMISRRDKFQRVYDLRERVLPDWDDVNVLDYETAFRKQVLNAVQALGIAREDWISPYFFLPKSKVTELLPQLVDSGQLINVAVDGMNIKAFYLHPSHLNTAQALLDGIVAPIHTTILSPFDPLINDRARTRALFNFDYAIECYLPSSKRKYGYFVLPVLSDGRFVARMDVKAWRKEGRLEVVKFFTEPGIDFNEALIAKVRSSLYEYAHWQGLVDVTVSNSDPEGLGVKLVR